LSKQASKQVIKKISTRRP